MPHGHMHADISMPCEQQNSRPEGEFVCCAEVACRGAVPLFGQGNG